MATQQYFCVLFILLVPIVLANGVRWGALVNAWPPIIDSNAPQIQDLAKFAVSEYNKATGSSLEYYKVLGGGSQPLRNSGRRYKLDYKVLGGGSQPLRNSGRRYKLEIKTIQSTSYQTLYDTFEAVVSLVCEDDEQHDNNCSMEVISFQKVL